MVLYESHYVQLCRQIFRGRELGRGGGDEPTVYQALYLRCLLGQDVEENALKLQIGFSLITESAQLTCKNLPYAQYKGSTLLHNPSFEL